MFVRLGKIVGWVAYSAALAYPTWASAKDDSAILDETMSCMLKVLQEEPGVQDPRIGVQNGRSFIEYRFVDENGKSAVVRFSDIKESDEDSSFFLAILPGIYGVGMTGPDEHGTKAIIKKWESQCNAAANVLFV